MKQVLNLTSIFPTQGISNKARQLALMLVLALLFGGESFCYAQTLICPSPASGAGDPSIPFTTSWNDNLPMGPKIIPVVVHLIGGSASGLTFTQVNSALSQLNADFNSTNPDWDIEFRLATFDPNGRCTNGITSDPDINPTSVYKPGTRWPTKVTSIFGWQKL